MTQTLFLNTHCFTLGFQLGYASFQSSDNKMDEAKKTLADAESTVQELQNDLQQFLQKQGVANINFSLEHLHNVQAHTTNDGIVFLRGEYYGALLNMHIPDGMPPTSYIFGITMGIAEGETTASNESAARPVIIDALTGVQQIAQSYITASRGGVSAEMVQLTLLQDTINAAKSNASFNDLQEKITSLRTHYQDFMNKLWEFI